MTTYTTITNGEIDQDSPVTQALLTALRDNLVAFMEGDTSSPYLMGMTLLGTANASSDAQIDFASAFDNSKYDSYLFSFGNIRPVTDAVHLQMRTSTDGGSTWDSAASDYGWIVNELRNGGNAASTSAAATSMRMGVSIGNGTSEHGCTGQVWLPHPGLSKRTKATWNLGVTDSSGYTALHTGSGERLSSGDVDGVRFKFSSGNIDTGTISMYGLRNS